MARRLDHPHDERVGAEHHDWPHEGPGDGWGYGGPGDWVDPRAGSIDRSPRFDHDVTGLYRGRGLGEYVRDAPLGASTRRVPRRARDERKDHVPGSRHYRRPEVRIRDDLQRRLEAEPDLDASDVEITVIDGVVRLDGTVERRADKYRIEDICLTVLGVADVDNRLRVDRDARWRRLGAPHAP